MRPLIAQINLSHLKHNYQRLKEKHGNKLLAVLKANAYGHGAVRCAQALADIADGFAVACIEEALALREAGITRPIVLLEGVFELEEYHLVEQHDLWVVVQSQHQLDGLLAHQWKKNVCVWLKMDSGMGRVGFLPNSYVEAYQQLAACNNVSEIVKMTHFSRADEPEVGTTEKQIAAFDSICADLKGDESMANSAAILAFPKACRQWGRAGLALYGISPMEGEEQYGLKPVMTLKAKVFSVRQIKAGSPIGYGAIYTTQQDETVGLVSCGYADGYPRRAATDTPIIIDDQHSRILGRVSMDMMSVELTGLSNIKIGSEVELWGEKILIHKVAAMAGTITYELLCNVKRARLNYIE